ncbi:MAG: hypothetical protein IKJ00_03170 [Clostridia bacterium]|nr:hypothetical protein [Clostridia bacterium]
MKSGFLWRLAWLATLLSLAFCLISCDGDTVKDTVVQLTQPQEQQTQAESESDTTTSDTTHTHSGGKATCSAKAICEACGKEYGELAEHPMADTYTKDETHHWYATTCTHTDVKSGYEKHSYTSKVTPPTCAEQGYTTYTCVCGYSYKDDYTPTSAHSFETAYQYNDLKHWHKATCEHTEEKGGEENHNFTQSVVPPTCSEQGYTLHSCVCGYSYKTNYVDAQGHSVSAWTKAKTELSQASSCEYAVTYEGLCGVCQKTQTRTEYIEQHSFYWSVAVEANCQNSGTKVKLCASEQCMYHTTPAEQTSYSDPDKHIWDNGTTVGSVTTYTCVCGETKRAVEVTGNTADISGSDVAATDEVKISDIVIGFDNDAKQKLSENDSVKIEASTLDGADKQQAVEELGLNQEQIAQLGDSVIYDFTVNNGAVSQLGGTATVRVPYTLKSGDNPEEIIVWYISNGELTPITATYDNGFAVFETTHFSYYTVTKIAPEERCKYYGHSNAVKTVAPTCDEEGYTLCLHCGEIIKIVSPIGHNWKEEIKKEASCDTSGLIKYACTNCKDTYEEILAATGHNPSSDWTVTDKTHSHKCIDCNTVTDEGEHKWDYEEATAEHGVSCTVCGFVREEKKPADDDNPLVDNTVKIEHTPLSDGSVSVSVKLMNVNMAGIRLCISYGEKQAKSCDAPEAAVYYDVGGRINYILAAQTNFSGNELTLFTFNVADKNTKISVEIVEIYVFDKDYNIIVPDYAESVN